MKLVKLKCILIIVITLAIFVKAGNVVSSLKFSYASIENTSSTDDATEKEEKKVESEGVYQNFFTVDNTVEMTTNSKTVVISQYFNKLAYFPEVLTPPPTNPLV